MSITQVAEATCIFISLVNVPSPGVNRNSEVGKTNCLFSVVACQVESKRLLAHFIAHQCLHFSFMSGHSCLSSISPSPNGDKQINETIQLVCRLHSQTVRSDSRVGVFFPPKLSLSYRYVWSSVNAPSFSRKCVVSADIYW